MQRQAVPDLRCSHMSSSGNDALVDLNFTFRTEASYISTINIRSLTPDLLFPPKI